MKKIGPGKHPAQPFGPQPYQSVSLGSIRSTEHQSTTEPSSREGKEETPQDYIG